jgi:hypothetical protein
MAVSAFATFRRRSINPKLEPAVEAASMMQSDEVTVVLQTLKSRPEEECFPEFRP